MKTIKDLKAELKELAKNIRIAKNERKTVHFKGERIFKSPKSYLTDPQYVTHYVVPELKYEFRHKHIAYCLLHGRTYEQIEPKVRPDTGEFGKPNLPDFVLIEKIKKEYGYVEEDVRLSA